MAQRDGPSMSEADDRRIKMVVMHIATSVHGARYRQLVAQRTKHNPNFGFMEPGHPQHAYYQDCLARFMDYQAHQRQQFVRQTNQWQGQGQGQGQPQQQQQQPQGGGAPDAAALLLQEDDSAEADAMGKRPRVEGEQQWR
jgi:hypothetical protein